MGTAQPRREPSVPDPGDMVLVPAAAQFPIEVTPPEGFDPEDLGTWPREPGRFEYVDGRLLYMPPCGELQGLAVSDTNFLLCAWQEDHQDFVVMSNEIGVSLGKAKRGVDVAVWRRSDLGAPGLGFARVPPVLAVEVAGRYEKEDSLREKAATYLANGVPLVWLVLPATREVVVLRGPTSAGARRYRMGEQVPEEAELPGLSPPVARFFRQTTP